jgi:hypothetical protein
MSYITHGRCKSGKRWFWFAAEVGYDNSHKCDDPVCVYGGPHDYGWEDTEELAVKAMAGAVARLGGEVFQSCYRGNAPGRAGAASAALKRINAARRKARPPKQGTTEAAPAEYLYEPWSWYDDYGEERKGINAIPVVKKTAKRIYYDNSDSWDRSEGTVTLGYISREDFETDTRCRGTCPHHGYTPDGCWRGSPAGCADLPGRHYGGGTVYATREAAEDYLYRWEREQERRKQRKHEPEVKRLRREMADAHPDRGGSAEEFMKARERYKRAVAR